MKNCYSKYFTLSGQYLAILIDPEKHDHHSLKDLVEKINSSTIDLIFVGSSLSSLNYSEIIASIKKWSQKPVIIFPGNSLQLSHHADALLNLSLISGRNPELLIGEHVKSAMQIKQSGIEVIPTGYVLIEGGRRTSVEYMSNTQSIPRSKPDIAVATAVAGELLGLKTIYLEAGSGAEHTVPLNTIELVKKNINIPIICGGGIRDEETIKQMWKAGANIVVLGSAFENNPEFLKAFI